MRRTAVVAAALLLAVGRAAGGGAPLVKRREVRLGGGGEFDLLTADAASRRLFVAHGTKVEVIDLDRAERVGAVEGLAGVDQAVVVPRLGRGFATESTKNRLAAFDASTLAVVKEIETGAGPDALLYVATTKEVWAMNHDAGTITCVDPASYAVKATIEVGGALEQAVERVSKGIVFVAVEDDGEVVAIDAARHVVKARYPLDPAVEPTGLALDEKSGVLFCGCRGRMAILDTESGRIRTTIPIGEGCDGVAFDAATSLAYASCADGTVAVIREVTATTFEAVATIPTAVGARTCALDATTHALWLAAGAKGRDDVTVIELAPEAGK